jgi:hypothetical protein
MSQTALEFVSVSLHRLVECRPDGVRLNLDHGRTGKFPEVGEKAKTCHGREVNGYGRLDHPGRALIFPFCGFTRTLAM